MADTLFEEIEVAAAPLEDHAASTVDSPVRGRAPVATAEEEMAQSSRLVEFPGATRTASHPQWRKDLSERVRQIQERRARESARGTTQAAQKRRNSSSGAPPRTSMTTEQAKGHPLGLVHPVDAPPTNPLVIAALKRIERARQPVVSSTRPRSGGGGGGAATAAAVARVVEEHYQPDLSPPVDPLIGSAVLMAEEERILPEKAVPSVSAPAASANASRALNLVVIAPQPEPQPLAVQAKPPEPKAPVDQVVVAAPTEDKAPAADLPSATCARPPRRVFDGVVDDAMLARRECVTSIAAPEIERATATFEGADDQASLGARVAGGIIDVLVVAFASSPFAAVIELTSGNWADVRVLASMGGIVAVIMFLYLSIATLLAGRTWGMSLVSVHPADVHTGLAPSTKQAVIRSLVYMISLVIGGLGMIYGLFDPEGRTAHDHLSGTVVLRD